MRGRSHLAIVAYCCLCVTACQRPNRAEEDCPQSNATASAVATDDCLLIWPDDTGNVRPFLVPFLPGHGIPAMHKRPCMYDFFYLGLDDIASYRERLNEPFSADILFDVAVWADGTVIWFACDNAMKPEGCRKAPRKARKYFRAELDAGKIAKHLAQFELPCRADIANGIMPHMPTAIAACVGHRSVYILCDLDAMELFGEYELWRGDAIHTYPTDRYSFEDFCLAVPKEYADYLKHYRRLRADLESLIPNTGEEIDPVKTVQWVFTDTPACGGVISDQGTVQGN